MLQLGIGLGFRLGLGLYGLGFRMVIQGYLENVFKQSLDSRV